jgi:VWFA-related protein
MRTKSAGRRIEGPAAICRPVFGEGANQMKKFALLCVLCVLGAVFASAQSAPRTRPRRVGDAPRPVAPPPPAASDDTADAPTPSLPEPGRRPPVLKNTEPGAATARDNAPGVANSGPQEVDEDEIVRVTTTLVTVPVSVLDRNGRYIPNLRQRDFQLFEDNQPQQIAYFSSVETPFTVALVIDTSGSTKFRLDEMQEAAIAFVNQLRPEDKVMVVTFDDKIRVLAEPTNNRYTLRDAIRQARVGEGTKLYDALDYVMNIHFHRIQGRKAIVLFTDGVDTTSKRANYQSTLQDAEELDALIYPVQYDTYTDMNAGASYPSGGGNWPAPQPRRRGSVWGTIGSIILGGPIVVGSGGGSSGGGGTGTSRAEYERGNAYLGELAERTGARRYQAATMGDVNQAFSLVAEELRRQYSIGYYPKNTGQAGVRRRIKVRVNRPDLVVRARDSYIYKGPSQDPAAPPNKPELRKQPLSTRWP